MKPLYLDPQSRISVAYRPLGGEAQMSLEIVEIDPRKLICLSTESPYLRGEVIYQGNAYSAHLIETKEQGKNIFYTLEFSEPHAQEIYVSLLKTLPPEELTKWLISLPEIDQASDQNVEQTKEKNKEKKYSENHDNVEIINQDILDHEEGLPPESKDLTRFLESFFVFFYKKPWLSLLILLLLSLFPVSRLKDITVDASLNRALVTDSPLMKQYEDTLEIFGSDKSAILYFRDPDIFTKEKLTRLRNLAWEMQKNPQVARVRSVFTSTFIRYQKEDETLYTEPMLQELEGDLTDKLKKVQNDPNLHGRLIDVPKNIIVIALEMDKDVKKLIDIGTYLSPIMEKEKPHFKEAFQSGEPAFERFQKIEIESNPKIFMPLTIVVLFFCFVFFLGSVAAFTITLVATFFSIIWAFGLMTSIGIPIQLMVNIVPGVVLTLCATEIVHISSSLKAANEKGLNEEDALRFLSRDIGKALFLTFATTAIGFMSIRISEIQMLQEFAIVSTIALCSGFLVTIFYVPVHLRFFGNKQKRSHSLKIFERARAYFSSHYYNLLFSKKSLIVICLFVIINSYFATKVFVDNDSFAMIVDRAQVKKDINTFKDEIGGMKSIHLVFYNKDQENPQKFTQVNNLNYIWKLHQELLEWEEIKSADSFPGLLAVLNREMKEGAQEFYRIPQNQNLVEQYFIMLSRDDVDPVLTPDKYKANIKISHDLSSSRITEKFLKKLEAFLVEKTKDSPFGFYMTSRNILNIHAANTLVTSQVYSLLSMSVVIIFLISLFFKSFQAGVLSLVPNLFPIFGLFGLMGLFEIPLNVGTWCGLNHIACRFISLTG